MLSLLINYNRKLRISRHFSIVFPLINSFKFYKPLANTTAPYETIRATLSFYQRYHPTRRWGNPLNNLIFTAYYNQYYTFGIWISYLLFHSHFLLLAEPTAVFWDRQRWRDYIWSILRPWWKRSMDNTHIDGKNDRFFFKTQFQQSHET